jgi:hypothetical protein
VNSARPEANHGASREAGAGADPAAPRRVRLDDVRAQPWRNGGGLTRELLAWPADTGWRVRVSVADIERDGPFSSFPGVERWFVVLEGNGVVLGVDGRLHELRSGDAPLRFDGASDTHCRLLDGPTRDLNLMLHDARGGIRAAVHAEPWSPPAEPWSPSAGGACGLYALVAGRCAGLEVAADTLLWFDRAPAALVFEAERPGVGACGWWLHARDLGSNLEACR